MKKLMTMALAVPFVAVIGFAASAGTTKTAAGIATQDTVSAKRCKKGYKYDKNNDVCVRVTRGSW